MKLKTYERIVVVGLFLLAAFLCLIVYWRAFPFQPYRINDISVKPSTVCGGEFIHTTLDASIAPGFKVSSFTFDSYWQGKNGQQLGSASGALPVANIKNGIYHSPVVRRAPDAPGTYRLYDMVTAYGTVGIISRSQVVMVRSKQISVMQCRKGGG